jgi:predicted secreted protein
MKKHLGLLLVLCAAMLALGCSEAQDSMATIKLEANATTGYTWVYAMTPEGVVREVSNEYIPDNNPTNMSGVGGKHVFTFEAISAGEAELVFSYIRPSEQDVPAEKTVTYKAVVNDKNYLSLKRK